MPVSAQCAGTMQDISQNQGQSPVRSIGIVAASPIPDDPRVRRQIAAFRDAGWQVRAFGLAGGRAQPPHGDLVEVAAPASGGGRAQRLYRKGRTVAHLLAAQALPGMGEWLHGRSEPYLPALRAAASAYRPDLWLANDWLTLPVVAPLANAQGVPFLYDTHEFATEEFAQNWKWRSVVRPVVRAIEARHVRAAAAITCVSDGIGEALEALYGLPERPLTVRNMPRYEETAFRPVHEPIRVLYHGIVIPGRALEETIASVARWQPGRTLTIRGPGTEHYLASLRALAAAHGVADRIAFAPPVPVTALVREASEFDLGLFALPGHSAQNRFVLPNKLFEYVMAGLAVCVSDLPEMRTIVERNALGRIFADVTPEGIAQAVNSMQAGEIEAGKRASLAAARELNWEAESGKLLKLAISITGHSPKG